MSTTTTVPGITSTEHSRTLGSAALLVNLAKRMDIVLDHVRREARGPKPHITIGRAKSGRNRDALLSFIKKNKHVKLGYMDVKVVCLKQSVLSREGPHYTDLKVFGLE